MTDRAVLFGDADAVVIALLEAGLAGRLAAPVSGEVPDPRPDLFVTVERTGGARLTLVADEALVSIDSWGPVRSAAHDLAQLVRTLVLDARGSVVAGVPVYRVREASGPGWLPDATSGHPRFRQMFAVALRGATLPNP